MTDIERLNELHAATSATQATLQDDGRWQVAIHNAWPDLYRELTEASKRLETLEEFARDVRDNYDCDSDAHKYGTRCRCCEAAKLLDAETTKAEG